MIGRRGWTATLFALALLLRVLVPAGFMPVTANGSIAFVLCSGHGPEAMVAMPGMTHGPGEHHDRAPDAPCGFSGLTAPSLAAADPVLLAVAPLFVMAATFRFAFSETPPRRTFLWPRLRGPPAIA